jgi:hypothetical protein
VNPSGGTNGNGDRRFLSIDRVVWWLLGIAVAAFAFASEGWVQGVNMQLHDLAEARAHDHDRIVAQGAQLEAVLQKITEMRDDFDWLRAHAALQRGDGQQRHG